MRYIRLATAGVVLAISSLCMAQTTNPTTAPTTHPATTQAAVNHRSATTLPSADSFLPRLGSDSWQVRQRAEEELVRLGEDARSIIKELLSRKLADSEVRTRLETALSTINENRATGTSFITIHMQDATPKEIFAELSKQCYSNLKPFPDNLFDQGDQQKVTIDIDRQPFWTAMNTIAEKTGIDLQQYNNGVRLMRGSFRSNSPYTVLQGPFLIVASQLTRTQTQMLANGGGSSSDFSVQLVAYSEPKLRVLNSNANLKLSEVVDDAGNSLIPEGPDNRGYYGGGGGVWQLYAQLKYPEKPGSKITHFKASAGFVIQTRSEKVQIPDIKKLKDLSRVVGEFPLMFRDLKKTGEIWELRISVKSQAMGGARWGHFNQSIQNNLKLLDADGQELDHRGMRSRGDNNGIEYTLMFGSSIRPGDGRRSTDPASVEWEVSTASKDVTVPFEFKNLPMLK